MAPAQTPTPQITPADHNAGQQWLRELATQHYIPLPRRALSTAEHPVRLVDPHNGNSLAHGALVVLRDGQACYEYVVTFGAYASNIRRLHVPLDGLYGGAPSGAPNITLAQLESALRLLVMAGSEASGPRVASGLVLWDGSHWTVRFIATDGRMAGSWPLGTSAGKASGEDAVFDCLTREVEPSLY